MSNINLLDKHDSDSLFSKLKPLTEVGILLIVGGWGIELLTFYFVREYLLIALCSIIFGGAGIYGLQENRNAKPMRRLLAWSIMIFIAVKILVLGVWGRILYINIVIRDLEGLLSFPLWQISLPIISFIQQIAFFVYYK